MRFKEMRCTSSSFHLFKKGSTRAWVRHFKVATGFKALKDKESFLKTQLLHQAPGLAKTVKHPNAREWVFTVTVGEVTGHSHSGSHWKKGL